MAETEVIVGRSPGQIAWRRFKRNKVGVVSAILSITFVLASLFAPIICKIVGVDPNTMHQDALDLTSGIPKLPHYGIGLSHPLGLLPGTGRDLFAQLLYGSRISFSIAFITSITYVGIGLTLGISAAYIGGVFDNFIGRIADFLLSFPTTFMFVALSVPLTMRVESLGLAKDNGARIIVMVLVLTIFSWPSFFRVVRSQVLSLREREFVLAAQALGASKFRIIFNELLPNLWPLAIIYLSISLPRCISTFLISPWVGLNTSL